MMTNKAISTRLELHWCSLTTTRWLVRSTQRYRKTKTSSRSRWRPYDRGTRGSWEARVQSTSEAYAEFYLKTFPHLFSMLPAVPADLSELQFAQHLLRYGDGRFARDEEFVCVVYSRLKQRRAAGICWKACGGSDTPPTKELLQHTSAVAKGDAEVTKKRCRRCELCNRMQKRCLVRSCTWPQNAARCYPG